MSSATLASIVSVAELRRAYQAVVAGQFRAQTRQPAGHDAASPSEWTPAADELVVLVVDACAGAGASSVGLGLAHGAGRARVVECCTVAASGLAAASTAEMGITPDGWVQGTRDEVLIERRSGRLPSLEHLPAPSPSPHPVTVLDCATDVDVLLASPSWIGTLARTLPTVLVVARPSAPGLRRLESAISLLGPQRARAVLVGVPKRWPRSVEQHLGPHSRRLRADGRLIGVPFESTLAVHGITSDPLPASLVAGLSPLLLSSKGRSE